MGDIYFPNNYALNLSRFDDVDMDILLDKAIKQQNLNCLSGYPFNSCGRNISVNYKIFTDEFAAYCNAKLSEKRNKKDNDMRCAWFSLVNTIRMMRMRVDNEILEREKFEIQARNIPEYPQKPHIRLYFSFKCRNNQEGGWDYGSITYSFDASKLWKYGRLNPGRVRTNSKIAEQMQRYLYPIWEQLERDCEYSLLEYFRSGGDPKAIPDRVIVQVDSQLNSYDLNSLKFWMGTECLPPIKCD